MNNIIPTKMIPTKQKILMCAVDLFAIKGFTETSVRDIAAAVGIKSASLYNHFSSKEEILEFMLNDFDNHTQKMFNNPDIPNVLQKNPTADGILSCLQITFSVLSDEYYLKVLHVIFHEQHRNNIVRSYVAKTILDSEEHVVKIFNILKNLNIIRHDADPDFWKKTASSLLYIFPNRTMLGVGHGSIVFGGMDLRELLYYMFDMIIKMYGITEKSTSSP